jgi:hypothetical protein
VGSARSRTCCFHPLQKAALGSELLEKILAAVDVQPPERRYFGLAVQEGGFMVSRPAVFYMYNREYVCSTTNTHYCTLQKWVLPNKQLKKQLAGLLLC